MRADGRVTVEQLRKIEMIPHYLKHPAGSVLIIVGDTKVICTASVEEKVPPFMRGSGKGWLSAEYSMLPSATETRNRRESAKGKLSGRTMEIQRLIGRSLRAAIDLEKLGERSIVIDCDVIQADGGTRTASITGAYVALSLAIQKMLKAKVLTENPIKEAIAAVSVGILPSGEAVCDLDYAEDFSAAVDMNVVMTASGKFIEVQGTGEESTFSRTELNRLLDLAEQGIHHLIKKQVEVLQMTNAHKPQISEKEILIATKNIGKAEEFKSLFRQKGYIVKTLLDYPEIPDIVETGTTFEENARLKAETIAQQFQMTVLADDSGLQVDELNGRPGVYSARFAGEDHNDAANNAKLLHELTGVPREKRIAQFHCTLVLASPEKESLVVEGEVAGEILTIPRGENGFGYDPLFFVPDLDKSMAELSQAEKNKISHRGRALAKLAEVWDSWITE